MPPSIIRLRIFDKGKSRIRLWLPLFLLWPVALAVVLLLLPLICLAQLILWLTNTGINLFRIFFGLYRLVCSLKGLHVNVDSPRNRSKVLIAIL
jgi:hypothetical protein